MAYTCAAGQLGSSMSAAWHTPVLLGSWALTAWHTTVLLGIQALAGMQHGMHLCFWTLRLLHECNRALSVLLGT